MSISQASHPLDVLWEKQGKGEDESVAQFLCAMVITLLVSAFTFAWIFLIQRLHEGKLMSKSAKRLVVKGVDCSYFLIFLGIQLTNWVLR